MPVAQTKTSSKPGSLSMRADITVMERTASVEQDRRLGGVTETRIELTAQPCAAVMRMSAELPGRKGELPRFGLGARSWFLTQMQREGEHFEWSPRETGRSAREIIEHAMWVVSVMCPKIGEDLGVPPDEPVNRSSSDLVQDLKARVSSAYGVLQQLCRGMDESMLERSVSLPPTARLREGSADRVLRVMAGYHVVHHAGQVAMVLRWARLNI